MDLVQADFVGNARSTPMKVPIVNLREFSVFPLS